MADDTELVVQTMVAVEQVERRPVLLREANAVLVRPHLVAPAMHDRSLAVEHTLTQLRQASHVERRRHQKYAARMQERGRRDGDEAAHAGPDEHEVALQLLAEIHESGNACARMVDAAVVDGLGLIAFAPR